MTIRPLYLCWVTLLAGLALLLATQVVAVNLGYYFSPDGDEAGQWQPHRADFLLAHAARASEHTPDLAIHFATQALLHKPVDARAYLTISLAQERRGNLDQAKLMAHYADIFGPRMTDNQLQLAAFWARQGDASKALDHWRVAIEMRPALGDTLFSPILHLAETAAYAPAVRHLMSLNPRWWTSFFLYAINHTQDQAFLDHLYRDRGKSLVGVTLPERQAYIDHLINGQRYDEAYLMWMDHLSQKALGTVGYVNDGGFNLPPSGEGFGWRFASGFGFIVSRSEVTLSPTSPALRVDFNGNRLGTNELVKQFIMLEPGHYEFNANYQVDSLNAGEGVGWSIHCANGSLIKNGGLVRGSNGWGPYSVEFEVPDGRGCGAQVLSLVSPLGGTRPFEYEGVAWFDDLVIKPIAKVVDI